MARKTNGHAEGTDTSADTPEHHAKVTARAAVDALDGDQGARLRVWLRDTLDLGTALNHFEADPDAARRELQNTIAAGLILDPDLTGQLAERVRGEWPVDAHEDAGEAEQAAGSVSNDVTTEATESDGEQEDVVVHVPNPPRVAGLAARQLKGDLTRYFLDRLQHEQGDRRPWSERTESHQRQTIAQIGDMVEAALRDGFSMMIGERTRVVTGRLESVTAKEDGIKAVIKLSQNADNILTLLTGAGEVVQIAVADPTAFMGYGDQVPVVLDQHVMPLTENATAAEPAAEVQED